MENLRRKKTFFNSIKIMILLTPLPFGCVGKIFLPLFYLFILVITLMGMSQLRQMTFILYEKWIRRFFYGFLVFLGLQIIPLPIFLLKILSPETVSILSTLKKKLPGFHSISLVSFETLVFAAQFLVFCFFFIVLVNIKLEKKEIISFFEVLFLSGVLQVVFGFLKYIQGNSYFFLFFLENDSTKDRLTGTLGNSDHFAFYLEMILPLALVLLFSELRVLENIHPSSSLIEKFLYIFNENKRIVFYFTVVIILGVGIILTGSRVGISTMVLAFIILALLSAFLRLKINVQQKLRIILIILICVVVFIGIQNTASRFIQTKFEKQVRFTVIWPGTIQMISDFPIFGTGFGTFRYSYYLYDNELRTQWTTHAHNDYLETLSDGGILGGILMLIPIGILLISLFRMWFKRRHPWVKLMGLGITCSLFTVLFHTIFDFSLRIPSNMFIFVFILILGIKIVNFQKSGKKR